MGKYGEDKKNEMIALGFMFDNQRAKYGFDLVKCALLKYKEIHGNFLVKQKFLVPSGSGVGGKGMEWPEKTWGIKLGKNIFLSFLCSYSMFLINFCLFSFIYFCTIFCFSLTMAPLYLISNIKCLLFVIYR